MQNRGWFKRNIETAKINKRTSLPGAVLFKSSASYFIKLVPNLQNYTRDFYPEAKVCTWNYRTKVPNPHFCKSDIDCNFIVFFSFYLTRQLNSQMENTQCQLRWTIFTLTNTLRLLIMEMLQIPRDLIGVIYFFVCGWTVLVCWLPWQVVQSWEKFSNDRNHWLANCQVSCWCNRMRSAWRCVHGFK